MSWKTIGGFLLVLTLLLNTIVLTVMVAQMSQAQKKVDLAQHQFNQIYPPIKKVLDVMNRFLHGSIPNLVNDFISIDFLNFGRNVSLLASAVGQSFDNSGDARLLQVSQYSSLVASVASKFASVTPNYGPTPAPTDDLGLLNVLSYLIDWTTTQTDPVAWKRLGKQCTAVISELLNTDWSGFYAWNHRQQTGTWNANSAKPTANTVYLYCSYVANLNPQDFRDALNRTRHANAPAPASVSASVRVRGPVVRARASTRK